jgi:hypothetical protein
MQAEGWSWSNSTVTASPVIEGTLASNMPSELFINELNSVSVFDLHRSGQLVKGRKCTLKRLVELLNG